MKVKKSPFDKYFVLFFFAWTIIAITLLVYNKNKHTEWTKDVGVSIAEAYFTKDLAFREWAASHGGVYVEIDSITPPNEFLTTVDEREITTPKGKKLTLMNPAYMIRQLNENFSDKYGLDGHITRINPIREENAPDDWERQALNKFRIGEKEVVEFMTENSEPILRYMKPLYMTESCLKCHSNLGYQVGDVGGGIAIILPISNYINNNTAGLKFVYASYFILWIIGVIGLFLSLMFIRKRYDSERTAFLKEIETADRYEKLSNLTFEGILIIEKGVIIDSNSALCNLVGYSQSELEGKNLIDFAIDDSSKKEFLNKTLLDHAYPFEIDLIVRSGNIIPVEIESLKTYIDGNEITTVAVRNILARKKAEATIEKVQKKLNLHFELTPLAVIEWDLNFRVVRWNKSAEEIFGFTFEEVVGRRANFLTPVSEEKDISKIWAQLKSMKSGKRSTNINKTKNGNIITCMWYNTPLLNDEGKLIGVASMAQDITTYKNAQEEIRGANEELVATNQALHSNMLELEKAKIKAEENEKLKSSFLANMSHEIRTPMNGVIGFSQLLGNPDLSQDKRQSFIDIISSSSEQLLSIVNDILDISKIETQQIQLRKESVSIHLLFDELELFYKLKSLKSEVEIIFVNKVQKHDGVIISDKGRLRQILVNLINNAIKFTEKGFVKISCELSNNIIQFSVEDTGVGIKEDDYEKIFKRFQQVGSVVNEVQSGAGLGLAISKGFVELMDGEIWLDSVPNKGTKFIVSIPNKKASSVNNTAIVVDSKLDNNIELNVLVAEDVDTNYMLISEYFTDTKVKLIRAKNGQEAVDICLNNEGIDFVLMDIRMPIMDGYEATRKIKQIRPDLQIIAITAFAFEEDRIKAIEAGCYDSLPKPIDKNKLFSILNKLFVKSVF